MSLSVTPINATPSLFLVLILVGGEHVIAEPLELLSYNGSHKEHCIEKPDEFFETREQRTKVNGELGPFSMPCT